MPFGIDSLATVGFVIGGDDDDRHPIGTAFRVTIAGPSRLHGYAVTAGHVLTNERQPELRFRHIDGTLEQNPIHPGWWASNIHDVAVAELPPRGEGDERYALPMEYAADVVDEPQLGLDVYYVGLLDPVVTMGEAGVPMVRSGTLGALYQQVQLEDDDRPPILAHLVDCRSYEGFSGSPCLIQYPFRGPALDSSALPAGLRHSLASDPRADEIGVMRYVTVLLGIFIEHIQDRRTLGYASNLGIGVVLPVERLREVLMSDELSERRRQAEED